MPKPNGFMVFTIEWRQRNKPNMSIAEATAACGAVWKNMNEEARKPYQLKAKKQKEIGKTKSNPFCTTGEPVSFVLKQKEERENQEQQVKRNTELMVKKSLRYDRFTTDTYIVFACNYFSKSLQGNCYIPAEISLAEFSLKRGILKTYHTHVNPGGTTYGNHYDAQVHSEETHKLPIPPNAIGENNLGTVYNEILKFIVDKENGGYRPIFVKEQQIHIAKSVTEFLNVDSNEKDVTLDFYPIQYLFYIMKETACKIGEISPPTNFATNSFFERDYFEYHTGISCEYHENIDRSIHCTQSIVVRSCYMFCDYMCQDVAVDIIPGRHVPTIQKVDMRVIEPKQSNYKHKQTQKLFNDESDKKGKFSSHTNDNFAYANKSLKKTKNFQQKFEKPVAMNSDKSESESEKKPVKNPFAWQNNFRYENIPPQPTLSDFDMSISDVESVSTANSIKKQAWREVKQEDERSESGLTSTSSRSYVPSELGSLRGRGRGRGRAFMYNEDFPALK